MQVFGLFKGPTLNRCRAKSDQQNLCVRDQKQSGSENGHVKLGSEGSDCIFFLMIFSKLFAKPPHKIGKSSTAQSFTFFKSKIKNIVRVGSSCSQAAWVSFNKNSDQGDMYKMRVQTTVYQEEP